MKTLMSYVLALGMLFFFGGCGTTGKNFNSAGFQKIVNGTTTKEEVKYLLGPPFKTGIQNGNETWIYEYNEYRLIGANKSKDITIDFNPDGTVKSHQFMSDAPSP